MALFCEFKRIVFQVGDALILSRELQIDGGAVVVVGGPLYDGPFGQATAQRFQFFVNLL